MRAFSWIFAVPVVAVVLSAMPAHATTLTFGSPELNYIILYEGNGGHHLAINNFGTIGIWNGNIGIGGTGTLAATGPGTLNGYIDFAAPNTGQASISNTTLNPSSGNPRFNVSDVTTALQHVNDYSATLGAEAGTNVAINTSSPQTILLGSGTADLAGNRVFNVTSFSSSNGQNLILKGDGTFTSVFDIHASTQFNGNILLEDLAGNMFGTPGYAGPSPDQIVFNLPDGANLTGGDTLQANNNGNDAHPNNIMYGIFLDPNGTISFVNTRLVGRIWGGDSHDMQIVSGDTLTQPQQQVPEPAAGTLVGVGLLALGLSTAARKLRRSGKNCPRRSTSLRSSSRRSSPA